MTTTQNKIIVKLQSIRESGNRESWFRTCTGVNMDEKGARSFIGEYLKTGEHRLAVGTVILHVEPRGSVKNQFNYATILVVQADGSTKTELENLNWKTQFVSVQDKVLELLEGPSEKANPLSEFSIEELQTEIARRLQP